MSDKARNMFPIAVDFVEGELPSSAKMNGLAKQARQGLSIVEHMLGDLWNQSGDALFSSLPDAQVMIPNLARYIGSAKHLSPRIPHLPGEFAGPTYLTYVHNFSNSFNLQEARLPYPPHPSSTYAWNTTRNNTPEANKSDVVTNLQWWVDTNTGDIYGFNLFATGETLTYNPGYIDDDNIQQYGIYGDLGTDITFNVIPDPDTDTGLYNYGGVKLEYVNGTDDADGYHVYLPPRMPLHTRIVDVSPQDETIVPGHSGNFAAAPDSAHSPRFFQSDNVAACTNPSYAAHYRYNLPKLLTDNWSASAVIPAGFVYLWDPTGTGTLIEGLVYSANSSASTWRLIVKGANLTTWLSSTDGTARYPLSRLTNSSHAPEYYPSNGLKLITVGAPLSLVVSNLIKQFINHDHSSQGSLVSRQVNHDKLGNLFDNTRSPYLDPSAWDMDGHPQYLHRNGFNTGRDKYGNALLGDLTIASTSSASNYLNLSADSHRLTFGQNPDGCNIYFSQTDGRLRVECPGFAYLAGGVRFSLTETPTAYFDFALNRYDLNALITSSKDLTINVHENLNISAIGTGDDPKINLVNSDYSRTTLTQASAGSLKISDPDNTTSDSGSLYVSKIFAGVTNDTVFGCGTQAGQWGPVRSYQITPDKFVLSEAVTSNDFTTFNGSSIVPKNIDLIGYGATDWNTPYASYLGRLHYAGGGLTNVLATTWIDLPWAEFGIVNIVMSWRVPEGDATDTFFGYLGWQEINPVDPGYVESTPLNGSIVVESDLYNINISRGTGSGQPANRWYGPLALYAVNPASDPHVVINQSPYNLSIDLARKAFFTLRLHASAHTEIQFPGITVFYRIKQY